MKPVKFFLIIIIASLTGCLSYNYIRPSEPSPGNPNKNPRLISSLQPVLSWAASGDPGVTFDIAVYEGSKDVSFWKGVKRSLGEQVYYREGLKNASHKNEISLKPEQTQNGQHIITHYSLGSQT